MGWRDRLDWPFFEDRHRDAAVRADAWAQRIVGDARPGDVEEECRRLVRALGDAGWLRLAFSTAERARPPSAIDVRMLCLLREIFASHAALLDFAFAMQGLGSGALLLAGSDAQRDRYLPGVMAGTTIAAFALSEPDAGSDVAALATTARPDDGSYAIDGRKTWISNGGIADFYVVFARTGEAPGSRGISAFVVDADTPGLTVIEKIDVMSPHPLATLEFRSCRAASADMLGAPGEGFKLAMRTLDVFRPSVAAAALGFSRRALAAATRRANERTMFGGKLADFQLTQAAVGEMATALDASALLTYRAAWLQDTRPTRRHSTEAAMAKLFSTESAQRIIDRTVQLFGGLGVVSGSAAERLYREIRALRIYEGATEVQQLIIGRAELAAEEAR